MRKTIVIGLLVGFCSSRCFAAACGPVYGADGIAVDEDGKVWVSHYEDVRLGRLDPGSGGFLEFLPSTKGNPFAALRNTWSKSAGFDYAFDFGLQGIAVDETRSLVWSTRFNDNKVLRFSKAERQFTELTVPGRISARFDIPIDAQGNVWFVTGDAPSQGTDGAVIKVSPDGKIETLSFPLEKFGSGAIAVDPAGHPWVSATPDNGKAELYAWTEGGFKRQDLPDVGRYIGSLRIDARGDLWFTAPEKNAIGRLRQGRVELFAIPTANASPGTMASDARGYLWFTEWYGRKLGRIAPDGKITEYPLPPEEEIPLAVKPDREGRVWFSVAFNYGLFRLDPATGEIDEFPLPVPTNWSRNASKGLSVCTVRSKKTELVADPGTVKTEQSAATEQMAQNAVLRHPKGYPRNRDAVLFEQKCQTACHTWYRVDKAAARRSDWGPTVDRMIEFNGAVISKKERERIVRYMNKNYAQLK